MTSISSSSRLFCAIALFVILLTVVLIRSTMYRPYIYSHHSLNTKDTYSGPAGRLWGVSVTPLHRNDLLPHAETFAQAAQVPRHLPRRLRESRKRQKVFRDACGTPANAKKFLERLAGLPQTPKSFPRDLRDSRKRLKVFRETCGTPANAKKFLERLAGLPQTPKSFLRHLRDSRKRQKVFRETCGTPANTHDSVKMSVRWRLAFFLTQGAGA